EAKAVDQPAAVDESRLQHSAAADGREGLAQRVAGIGESVAENAAAERTKVRISGREDCLAQGADLDAVSACALAASGLAASSCLAGAARGGLGAARGGIGTAGSGVGGARIGFGRGRSRSGGAIVSGGVRGGLRALPRGRWRATQGSRGFM